jgi:hypothetical protein
VYATKRQGLYKHRSPDTLTLDVIRNGYLLNTNHYMGVVEPKGYYIEPKEDYPAAVQQYPAEVQHP